MTQSIKLQIVIIKKPTTKEQKQKPRHFPVFTSQSKNQTEMQDIVAYPVYNLFNCKKFLLTVYVLAVHLESEFQLH